MILLTTPIWLFALVPWAALTVWLLWGRRRRVDVPFLDLWEGPEKGERTTRLLHVPPLALMLAIIALMLAVLAAAGPRAAAGGRGTAVVVVDHGITMPHARMQPILEKVTAELRRRGIEARTVD